MLNLVEAAEHNLDESACPQPGFWKWASGVVQIKEPIVIILQAMLPLKFYNQ